MNPKEIPHFEGDYNGVAKLKEWVDQQEKRIKELEAQVPKVVTLDARTGTSKGCDCGKLVCRFDNYCYNCGSRLNWENNV